MTNQQYTNLMCEQKAMTVGNLSNPQYSQMKDTLTVTSVNSNNNNMMQRSDKNNTHQSIEAGPAMKHGGINNTSLYLNSHGHT